MIAPLQTAARAATAGFLLTLPFALLELATFNLRLPFSSFPVSVFVAMWTFAGLSVYGVLSVVRMARAGLVRARAFSFVLSGVGAGLMAWAWIGLVVDQMPCFLGGRGC